MFKRKQKSDTSLALPRASKAPVGMIGLDIAENCIHMCQLKPKGDGCFTITSKASVSFTGDRDALLTDPGRLKKILTGALKKKHFKGRKVVALMPWSDVKVILLTYKSNVADVDGEIIRLVSKRIDGDIDDYVVDYLPVRCNPSDEEHMAAVSLARKDKVMTLLEVFDQCGLDVNSLDIAPAALRRLVSALYEGKDASNVLLINVGANQSFLTIISGRRLLFDQAVEFGESQLLESVAEDLNIDKKAARELILEHGVGSQSGFATSQKPGGQADISATLLEILKPCFVDLVEEINRVLIFTASETHGVPVSRVCLLGKIAAWSGVDRLLLSLLDVEIAADQSDFWRVFQDENDNTTVTWSSLFPEQAIATGLALRGLIENE
jgi:type IV pilus assembly protein PilM